MNVLLVCSGGMSSSIVADNLLKEANKNGMEDFTVEASSVDMTKSKLETGKYNFLLLAPQVAFKKSILQKEADKHKIPMMVIKGILYTPMGSSQLYSQIMESLK